MLPVHCVVSEGSLPLLFSAMEPGKLISSFRSRRYHSCPIPASEESLANCHLPASEITLFRFSWQPVKWKHSVDRQKMKRTGFWAMASILFLCNSKTGKRMCNFFSKAGASFSPFAGRFCWWNRNWFEKYSNILDFARKPDGYDEQEVRSETIPVTCHQTLFL